MDDIAVSLKKEIYNFRHFTKLAVDAVLRLKGSGNLKAIQIIKISGGLLEESFLDEGFLLNKKVDNYN